VRVVLDSSVLIAAAISRAGVCAELLEDVLSGHELIVSDFIVLEVTRKLKEKFHFPDSDIHQLRRFLLTAGMVVSPASLPSTACRDPADVPVIGTAVSGEASLLITVDKDLLSLGHYEGVRMIKPGQFWELSMRGGAS
jgi:putative PIN family toxin of toxin-antitoxin system